MPEKETHMKTQLNDDQRLSVPAGIFGHHFGTRIEPDVFAMASRLSPDYKGGYWEFYRTEQGAFFMAPSDKGPFLVCSNNGYEGYMSAEAFGLTACLYVYSLATFTQVGHLLDVCADQFHLLRDYAIQHPEASDVFQAID
jgi:hypothetical protein